MTPEEAMIFEPVSEKEIADAMEKFDKEPSTLEEYKGAYEMSRALSVNAFGRWMRATNDLDRLRLENARLVAINLKLRGLIEQNHKWHQEYDEHEGYPDSELCDRHLEGLNNYPPTALRELLEPTIKLLERCKLRFREERWFGLVDMTEDEIQRLRSITSPTDK